MRKPISSFAKLFGLLITVSLVSACSVVGSSGSPQQIAQAQAVHAFDENRAPFGQRVASARAFYKPGVYGLNPHFGR